MLTDRHKIEDEILGDIVLNRRAWFVKTEWIPKQEEGVVALNQWLDENGIDKEIFLGTAYFEKTGEDLIKPQYITFMNP